ncbi:MAG TPA: ABC-F family ATP-binding cassette domain-containing protein [Planctomycetota bacterium]|nr:ABC-F family ATP-binding cassette domain-containing protein [Planctomycetota bacterium]
MALVSLQDVHRSFAERHLLRGVSLAVEEKDRIALVGPNGCGKSTLLKIVAGLLDPDEGARVARKGATIGYLEQEPVLDPARSVLEVVSGGAGGDHRAEAMISRLGLEDPKALCGSLSGGERRRVALARLLVEEPDLLLLDEPTNHLDAIATDWLEGWLLGANETLLMVTHDRYFLDRVATRILEIDRGQIYAYEGGYEEFLVLRAARMQAERSAERSRLSLLRRETLWLRRKPPAQRRRPKSRLREVEALAENALEVVDTEPEFLIPPGPRLGAKGIELKGVSKWGLFKGLDLSIGARERVGIVGPNGAGKTTLLRLCMGLLPPDAGTVEIGSTVKFAYIDQARSELRPDKSVVDEVGDGSTWVRVGDRDVRVESFLDGFLFPREMFQTPVGKLSGGERNRVLLAKLLLKGGNVLVLDEPTNDLDLMTLRVLEEALAAFEGSALVVSHDRYFLDRVATKLLYCDGTSVRHHAGDASSLLDRMREDSVPRSPPKSPPVREKPAVARLTYMEKQELKALPDAIAAAEARLAGLDARLSDPALYASPDVKRVTADRQEAAAEVARLYARWEDLEAREG